MSKITTEDCVKEIRKTYPGNWKRISKSGNAQTGIVRVFQDGDKEVTITEHNGVLTVSGSNHCQFPVTPSVQVVVAEGFSPVPLLVKVPIPEKGKVIPDKVVVDFVKKHFGPNPTVFDFKVAAAAIKLRSILPPSFASSALVKALRGTAKAKAGQNDPAFGIVDGMSAYKNNDLFKMCEGIHALLKQGDVLEMEELVVDEDSMEDINTPVYLTDYQESQHKVDKKRCAAIAEAFYECAEKYGKVAPEPGKKATNHVKPDDFLDKLKKSGVWAKACKKAEEVANEFLEKRKDKKWEPDWIGKPFRSKGFKDGIVTLGFFCFKPDKDKYGIRYGGELYGFEEEYIHGKTGWNTRERHAPVLISRWNEDGSIIDWEVKMLDYKGH